MKIAIRTDASPSIGMGHLMRCMNLAEALESINVEVLFLYKHNMTARVLNSRRLKLIKLIDEVEEVASEGYHYGDLDALKKELTALQNYQDFGFDAIIVDSYNVTNTYFKSLSKIFGRVIYIDDINAFNYDVDLVHNGHVFAQKWSYPHTIKHQLLGPDFNLIHPTYCIKRKRPIKENVESIFLSTGGSDVYQLIPRILGYLVEHTYCQIHCIIGTGFNNDKEIKEEFDGVERVILYENITNVRDVLVECDLAITGAGTMLYESCALGVPHLSLVLADNQNAIAKAFSDKKCTHILEWNDSLSDRMEMELKVISSESIRNEMVRNQISMIDCKGVYRTARYIQKFIEMVSQD